MKYIISESQYNKLGKLIEKEINFQINELKKMDEDNPPDWVHDKSIDAAKTINNVIVTSVSKHPNNEYALSITMNINLDSITISPFIDSVFDTVFDELDQHFGKIGYFIDEINRPNREW
jgi:hypothetical protein